MQDEDTFCHASNEGTENSGNTDLRTNRFVKLG